MYTYFTIYPVQNPFYWQKDSSRVFWISFRDYKKLHINHETSNNGMKIEYMIVETEKTKQKVRGFIPVNNFKSDNNPNFKRKDTHVPRDQIEIPKIPPPVVSLLHRIFPFPVEFVPFVPLWYGAWTEKV